MTPKRRPESKPHLRRGEGLHDMIARAGPFSTAVSVQAAREHLQHDRKQLALRGDAEPLIGALAISQRRMQADAERLRDRFRAETREDAPADLLLAATSSSGGSTLTVNAGDWTSLLAADAGGYDDAQEAICIRMRDGSRLYRLVTGVSGSGANRVVTCDGTWPSALSDTTVSGISWMPLVRFASDILELSWLSNAVAETQINFQSIMTEDAA